MRSMSFGALGLLLGLGASSIGWTGCGCPLGLDHPDLMGGGQFVLRAEAWNGTTPEGDYALAVSKDAKQLVETFTQGGKRYELRYAVGKRTEY